MQKRQNRRKTQRGGAPKKRKTSASKKNNKSRFARFKKLFSYESPPATDAKKFERAAELPFFNTYKSLAIKEGKLMPSMVK